MLRIDIPGFKTLELACLVLDYNGTLACDGELIPGVRERIDQLAAKLEIHVLTADTFGKAASSLRAWPGQLSVLPAEDQAAAKLAYLSELGAQRSAAIGNGRNDRLMVQQAALGIAVLQAEGAATETLQAADVICPDILAALDLLLRPLRLVATLRS